MRYRGGDLNQIPLIYRANVSHFQRISVTFDARDLQQNDGPISDFNNGLVTHLRGQVCLGTAWTRKLLLLRKMKLKALTMDVKRCYCHNGCCRMLMEMLNTDSLLIGWTRYRRPTYNNAGSLGTILDSGYVRDRWQSHQNDGQLELTPPNLANMEVRLTGLEGKDEFQIAHRKGFGCEHCIVENGVCDTVNCTWKIEEGFSDSETDSHTGLFD